MFRILPPQPQSGLTALVRAGETCECHRWARSFALGTTILVCPIYAQRLQKLKVAEVVRSQLFAPIYVAMSEGFMRDEGIDLELVTANGGDRERGSRDQSCARVDGQHMLLRRSKLDSIISLASIRNGTASWVKFPIGAHEALIFATQ